MIMTSCTKDSTDDKLGDWEQIKSGFPGVARNASVSFTIGDLTYLGLGFDGNGERLSDFWSYNPEKGFWDKLGRASTDKQALFPGSPRNGAVAFALNGKGYVGLGDDDQGFKADFYEYDPAKRSWRQLPDFPGGGRRGAVAFVAGGKAYVGTGYNDNYLVDLWVFNPKTDIWEPARDYGGSKREGATAIAYNGKIYVGFGISNGIAQKSMYVFDPENDTWKEVGTLDDDAQDDLEPRSYASAFVIDSRIFFFGGSNGGTYLGDIWAYNPALDTWTEHTPISEDCGSARATTVAFAYKSLAYVTTGYGSGGRYDDLWFFMPDKEKEDCK
jgi:N-acetylneuraminic acid mutarotase